MSRKNVNPPATSASDLPPLLLVRHLSEYRIIGGDPFSKGSPPIVLYSEKCLTGRRVKGYFAEGSQTRISVSPRFAQQK